MPGDLAQSAIEPGTAGVFTAPIAKLARMVSLSADFQRETLSATPSDALRSIHWSEARPQVTPRPFAVVRLGDGFAFRAIAGGARLFHVPSGSLFLLLEIDTPQDLCVDPLLADLHAMRFFERVLCDVVSLAGADDGADDEGHLPITEARIVHWGENPEEDWPTQGRFYSCLFEMQWGYGG